MNYDSKIEKLQFYNLRESKEYRSISGEGNNCKNANWGKSDTPLIRKNVPCYKPTRNAR